MRCIFCNFENNTSTDTIFCSKCGKVIPLKDENFFELFQLPISFDVDPSLLNTKQLKLLGQLHPDKFITSSAQEKDISLKNSSLINKAFRVLKDPILRAEHIFLLKGIDTENQKITDNQFLMEAMEWRENGTSTAEIKKIWESTVNELKEKFHSNLYEEALQIFLKLKFIKRFIDESE